MNNERKNILWLGVTIFERDIHSERLRTLLSKYGAINVMFTDNNTGMETYESIKGFLEFAGEWDVIATDQEKIDESWENFFVAQNWGKQIVQYKNGEWVEVRPGFSKQNDGKQK